MTGIRVTVAHARIGLGEPFTVTVDAQGTGTLSAPDGPFVEVGSPRITRSDGHIRIVKSLVCVDRSCAPDGKLRTVSLPAATSRQVVRRRGRPAPPSRSHRACRLWPYQPRGPPTGLRPQSPASRRRSPSASLQRSRSSSPVCASWRPHSRSGDHRDRASPPRSAGTSRSPFACCASHLRGRQATGAVPPTLSRH